jgi:hypothetical protein
MYKIHASQGQGDCVIDEFKTLKEALKFIRDNKGFASMGITYPDGSWYDFKSRGKRVKK